MSVPQVPSPPSTSPIPAGTPVGQRRISPIRRSPTIPTPAPAAGTGVVGTPVVAPLPVPNPVSPPPSVPVAGTATGTATATATPVRRISPIRKVSPPIPTTPAPATGVATSPTRLSPRRIISPTPAATESMTSPIQRTSPVRRISPVRTAATSASPVRRISPAAAGTSETTASPVRRISPDRSEMTTSASPVRRISPVRTEATSVSPVRRISPIRETVTTSPVRRISPVRETRISVTRVSPTGERPTISPVRRDTSSPISRSYQYPHPRRLIEVISLDTPLTVLAEDAVAAAAILAADGMVQKHAKEYAAHYAKDHFWRHVFAKRYPRIFAQTGGDLPRCPVKGLKTKDLQDRPLASWREYFQLMSGNLHQDEMEVLVEPSFRSFHGTTLWTYHLPYGEVQDETILHTHHSGKHILCYYYPTGSYYTSLKQIFAAMGGKIVQDGMTIRPAY